jgi:NADPH-dependent curcumin reductase CurA
VSRARTTQFRPGDAVFGDLSGSGYDAFAEYVAAPAHAVALKPAGLTFEQAAAVPSGALTALQGLRDAGQLQPGQKVLVNGASGNAGKVIITLGRGEHPARRQPREGDDMGASLPSRARRLPHRSCLAGGCILYNGLCRRQ